MKLSDTALAVLRDSTISSDASVAVLQLPDQQLDRKVYVEVAGYLKEIGLKWDRKTSTHRGPAAGAGHFWTLVGGGAVTTAKELGYFPTPQELVSDCTDFLREALSGCKDLENAFALDPSCGDGRMLKALASLGVGRIVGIEIDPARAKAAFSCAGQNVQVFTSNFLTVDFTGSRFDVVMMNPPFIRTGATAHLAKALSLCNPGAAFVAIMDAGFMSRERDKVLRDAILACGTIEDLGPDAFKEAGTRVRTVVVKIRRVPEALIDTAGNLV